MTPCSLLSMAQALSRILKATRGHLVLCRDASVEPDPTDTDLEYARRARIKKIHETTSARPTTLATCKLVIKMADQHFI